MTNNKKSRRLSLPKKPVTHGYGTVKFTIRYLFLDDIRFWAKRGNSFLYFRWISGVQNLFVQNLGFTVEDQNKMPQGQENIFVLYDQIYHRKIQGKSDAKSCFEMHYFTNWAH